MTKVSTSACRYFRSFTSPLRNWFRKNRTSLTVGVGWEEVSKRICCSSSLRSRFFWEIRSAITSTIWPLSRALKRFSVARSFSFRSFLSRLRLSVSFSCSQSRTTSLAIRSSIAMRQKMLYHVGMNSKKQREGRIP